MYVQGFAIGTEGHEPNPETECVQTAEDIGYGIGIGIKKLVKAS